MINKLFPADYDAVKFRQDFLASIVVFLVALPLCLGIAIASGLPPTAGIITGIVGGLIVGTISGSPLTVSGPAAGLVVIVADIILAHGVAMFGVIVLLAGLLQILAGSFKMGIWFRAISPSVIHGMLAGIGILIIASQFHIMLDRDPLTTGLQNLAAMPLALYETIIGKDGNVMAKLTGILTIVSIVLWTRFAPQKLQLIPGALVGALIAILFANMLSLDIKYITDLFEDPADLDDFFSMIQPIQTETLLGALDWSVITAVIALAFIASAESLLSSSAVDKLQQRAPRTKYDKELVAQGVGNSLCGLMGALPMTGVIVRSSANVQAGAVSRLSTIIHGGFLLLFVSVFLFTLQYIPVASLAAILVFTGYKLAYPKVLKELIAFGKFEVAIYAITIVTIVATNLLAGIVTGLILSLIRIVYIFAHISITVDHKPSSNDTVIHLKGSATFLGIPKLASTLESMDWGRNVQIQFDDLEYIDHACIELLEGWQKQYVKSGGTVKIDWDTMMTMYHGVVSRQLENGPEKA